MRTVLLGFLIISTVLLSGCDASVDPIVGTDQAFSMYGVLQPRADTQWVRVYRIEDQLTPTPATPLDATVRSTALETGQTQTWRDSIIQDLDGNNAHVFWHPSRVDHGRTYQLEVTGPRGRTVVEVAVPDSAALVLQPTEINSAGVFTPVLINRTVPRLLRVEVEYFFQYDFSQNQTESPLLRATRSYDGAQRREDGGWVVPINLVRDLLILREQLNEADLWNPLHGLVMVNMTLRLAVVNDEWNPPGGTFDAEVLAQPGTMSNVQNGFGFVGAGYRLEETWTPDIETLTRAGWTDPNEF